MEDLVSRCLSELRFQFAECEDITVRLADISDHLLLYCSFTSRFDGTERRVSFELGHRNDDPEALKRKMMAAFAEFETYIASIVRPHGN